MARKKKEDEEFINIGDEKEEILIEEKTIIYDGSQFIVKLPTKLIRKMEYQKGDSIKFTLLNPLPTEPDKKPSLNAEYVKKN